MRTVVFSSSANARSRYVISNCALPAPGNDRTQSSAEAQTSSSCLRASKFLPRESWMPAVATRKSSNVVILCEGHVFNAGDAEASRAGADQPCASYASTSCCAAVAPSTNLKPWDASAL